MNVDQDTGSFLLAVEKNSGRVLWRRERPHAQRGYATPVLYRDSNGRQQVLLAGSYRLSLKQARLQGAPGEYYASPVAADGKIYTVSEEGKVVVIQAGAEWQILQVNDLGDGCKGTPAIADANDSR